MKRKIVITGASSEIGLAILNRVAAREDSIIAHCNRNSAMLAEANKIFGANLEIIKADFTDRNELNAFCEKLGDVDILINAAALTVTDLLVNLDAEDISRMIQINISAVVEICRKIIPSMVARRRGVIINISSVTASRANRGQSVYAGTKGFIESFTRALAAEYGSRGLRSNCIAPGPVDSGSLKELLEHAAEEVKNSVSLKRIGTPDDIAAAAAFLCSNDASFINGQVIAVDGGFMTGV